MKFNKSTQEALEQIKDKHYDKAFNLKNKEIVKVGLNFSVEDEVNTLKWVIEKTKNPDSEKGLGCH